MAKESMKAREVKRAKLVAKYADKRKKFIEEGSFRQKVQGIFISLCFLLGIC
jgi:hypothetical protein